jgi:hypothetical protein
MKSPFRLTHLLLIVSLGFTACDELFDDEIPPVCFKVIELNPDVIYVWIFVPVSDFTSAGQPFSGTSCLSSS